MKIAHFMSCAVLFLVAMAASAQQANQPPKDDPTRTKVVLLGTGTPVPDPDRSGPATAIVDDDNAYLVDFGPGLCGAPKGPSSTCTLPHLSPLT